MSPVGSGGNWRFARVAAFTPPFCWGLVRSFCEDVGTGGISLRRCRGEMVPVLGVSVCVSGIPFDEFGMGGGGLLREGGSFGVLLLAWSSLSSRDVGSALVDGRGKRGLGTGERSSLGGGV